MFSGTPSAREIYTLLIDSLEGKPLHSSHYLAQHCKTDSPFLPQIEFAREPVGDTPPAKYELMINQLSEESPRQACLTQTGLPYSRRESG
jgi:hypothetical protein